MRRKGEGRGEEGRGGLGVRREGRAGDEKGSCLQQSVMTTTTCTIAVHSL